MIVHLLQVLYTAYIFSFKGMLPYLLVSVVHNT